MSEQRGKLVEELAAIVGPDRVTGDPSISIAYTRDSFATMGGIPQANFIVVQPESEGEVQEIVRFANRHRVRMLIKAAGTNVAGVAIPHNADIVLDLKRMNRILEINEELMTATVEPGVTHGMLAKAARARGLRYLGPEGPYSGTVIGNIVYTSMKGFATKYGQQQVISLNVVLPTGELLRTGSASFPELAGESPFYRNSPLLDLNTLFTFTRGEFGVVTRATIRLAPIGEREELVMLGFDSLEAMCRAMQRIQRYDVGSFILGTPAEFLARALVSVEKLADEAAIRQLASLYPPHLLLVLVEGTLKQVEADLEIVDNVLSEEKGARVLLNGELRECLEEMLPPVRRSPRLLYPHGATMYFSFFPPVAQVPALIDELGRLVESAGFRWGYFLMPQDRGLNTYFELDVYYDPLEDGIASKLRGLLGPYREIRKSYKGCSTAPSSFATTGVYYELAKRIKDLVDPNRIMNTGRLFRS